MDSNQISLKQKTKIQKIQKMVAINPSQCIYCTKIN